MRFLTVASTLLLSAVSSAIEIPAEWSYGFNASTKLSISYQNQPIPEGTLIPLQSVSAPPTFSISGLSTDIHSVVIVFVDPDSRVQVAPSLHWLQSGWHPLDEATHGGTMESRTPVPELPYEGPNPRAGGGANRYCFLAFQEGPKGTKLVNVPENTNEARWNFDVEAWRQANNLPPAFAGTFFMTERKLPANATVTGAGSLPSPTGNATNPVATLPPQFTDVGSGAGKIVAGGLGLVGAVAAVMGLF